MLTNSIHNQNNFADTFLLTQKASVEITVAIKFFCDRFYDSRSHIYIKQRVVELLLQRNCTLIHMVTKRYFTVLNNVHYLTVFKSAMAFKKRGKEHINIFRKTETFVIKLLVDCTEFDHISEPTANIYTILGLLSADFQHYVMELREHSNHVRSVTFCTRSAINSSLLK